MRKVRSVNQRPDGVFLTLDCNHTMWLAGPPQHRPPATFPCLAFPCYRGSRYMGI
jgi:hypothetical protein